MSGRKLRIAFCLPKITGGADLLQQEQIAAGLQAAWTFPHFRSAA